MPDGSFVDAFARLEAALATCRGALDDFEAQTNSVRQALTQGADVHDVVESIVHRPGGQARLMLFAAWQDLERAIGHMRSRFVRTMVDDLDMTLSEIGGRLDISRQSVSRLYEDPYAETAAEG